ncbi:MAG: UbiX family flavin prenyltransferase [Bilifractor sp.]
MNEKKKIIVGATGASGSLLTIQVLKYIRESPEFASVLILSEGARLTLSQETDIPLSRVASLADEVLSPEEIGAGPASGSFETAGMIVVPCSMKTLAGIASGYAENLLLRAADVTIKEHRPLVLAVRESPLSPIHLRNMQELSVIPGVYIMPPVMTFYMRPDTLDDMVRQVTARMVAPFGIHAQDLPCWQGIKKEMEDR